EYSRVAGEVPWAGPSPGISRGNPVLSGAEVGTITPPSTRSPLEYCAMSPAATAGSPMPRHALGLPAGSIRALLAFGVLAALWVVVWTFGRENEEIRKRQSITFFYLQSLMLLITASFFASHGSTIGPHISIGSPLGLPRGSVRFLLIVGYLGLA